MSRYRTPPPQSSPYITPEGQARLRAEYDQLWRVRRPEVVRALSAAAAEGDRSENAEYIYRKKELREIDRRVRYLQLRLPELRVVERSPAAPTDRVRFGAQLQIKDEDGRISQLRIVGADEIGAPGQVSIDSPLARALLGKQAGDTVTVRLPAGERIVEIGSIRFEPPP
jgi:transcription elongation factor GreB